MVFLNPAVLLGLLAASIPVLIHLLNLRKLKRIEFSTLAFLKEIQKTKVRRIKLKQWFLLLLRVLIVTCLVMAFARPALENVTFGGASSAAKTSAVFIIDNTYSMSVVGANGSYLNQSKQSAQNILNEFHEGDDITIIETAGDEPESNGSTERRNNKENIGNIEIRLTANSIYDGIAEAVRILNASQNFNKEIYVFSDFQKGNNEEIKKAFEGLIPDSRIKLYAVNVSRKEINNFAVTDVKVNNQIFEVGKSISVAATVSNKSSNAGTTVASLYLNGRRSAQQSVSLNPGESIIVNFESTLSETGLIEILVEVEDDDILPDNKRYSAIRVPEKFSVLILYENKDEIKFIETVLNGFSNGNIETEVNHIGRINSITLEKYDVVFLQSSVNQQQSQKLLQYLNGGGNVILFPSNNSSLVDFVFECKAFKLPSPERLINVSNNADSFSSIDKIDFQHPVFSNLFEREEKKQISSPEISKYFYASNTGSARRIISLVDNSIFMAESNVGSGKALGFFCAPILTWSDFPLKGIFAPLIIKSVFYLSSQNVTAKDYFPGDVISFSRNNISGRQIKVITPGGGENFLSPDSLNSSTGVRFFGSGKTGVYKLYSDDELADFCTVNVNTLESEIDYFDIDEFENTLKESGFTSDVVVIDPGDNYSDKISQARFGLELWRVFLIAALLLAITEMFVSKSSKKDLANVN